MLKYYPKEEQPREKAIRLGFAQLSEVELLALLLRTGNKQESVIVLAQRLIYEIGGFQNIQHMSYYDLIQIKGIKEAKAISILAGIEIAKRISTVKKDKYLMNSPKAVYHLLKNRFLFEEQEKVMVLCLNARLELIKEKTVFIGSTEMSIVSGKEILKEAVISGCSRIILIHNHPSGNPQPSKEDREITEKIGKMSKELEIELLDHIIFGENCFYSFTSNTLITCIGD